MILKFYTDMEIDVSEKCEWMWNTGDRDMDCLWCFYIDEHYSRSFKVCLSRKLIWVYIGIVWKYVLLKNNNWIMIINECILRVD